MNLVLCSSFEIIRGRRITFSQTQELHVLDFSKSFVGHEVRSEAKVPTRFGFDRSPRDEHSPNHATRSWLRYCSASAALKKKKSQVNIYDHIIMTRPDSTVQGRCISHACGTRVLKTFSLSARLRPQHTVFAYESLSTTTVLWFVVTRAHIQKTA